MAPQILQEGCTIQCTHGATVQVVTTNMRVKVGGAKALLVSDTFTVAGCPFTLPGPTPSPCVTVEWSNEARNVKVGGTAVLLETSIGQCKNAQQAVQGVATVGGVQSRVGGT